VAIINLSSYNIIGIIAFSAVAVAGITIKIILHAKRKKMDGITNFISNRKESSQNNGWEEL